MKTNTNTIKSEITDINKNLEDFEEQHKHEFKELRKVVKDIETNRKLFKQQYKEEFKEFQKIRARYRDQPRFTQPKA